MIYEALKRLAIRAALVAVFAFAFSLAAQQPAGSGKDGSAAVKKAQTAPAKDPFADTVVPVMQPLAPAPGAPAVQAAAPAPAQVQPDASANKQDGESLESLTSKVNSEKKSLSDLEAQIIAKTSKIQEMLDNYDKAEKNLTGFNGLGRVEQMELKSELYAGERLARKRIGDEFSSLSSAVQQWESLRKKIREDLRLLTLKKQIADLKSGNDGKGSKAQSAAPSSLADIEYYQVKKDADLRTISSYPDVYGTSDLWESLYKANRDKLQDPNKLVPEGTTLVVPQDVKRNPDFSDL